MAHVEIKNGLDIKLKGAPLKEVTDIALPERISVYPSDFKGIKPRLQVKEGEYVKRGQVLFYHKKIEAFQYRSPYAGHIEAIHYGPRRRLDEIVIRLEGEEQETVRAYSEEEALQAPHEEMLAHLQNTGLIALLQQRPFSKPAFGDVKPKSIFVNAMATAPFRPDASVLIQGREADFQLGLNALTRLTDGEVHLCMAEGTEGVLAQAKHVQKHTFSGPHPSGNTSTHIHFIDPIVPGDTVWAIRAEDVILIGELLKWGSIPFTKFIAVGGLGVQEGARKHYRVPVGMPLNQFLTNQLAEGEQRVIYGDALSGTPVAQDSCVRLLGTSITILPEERERHFMGWLAPGINKFSTFRAYLSAWVNKDQDWALGTSRRGSLRSMVLTGIYDKYTPLDIMVDYMVRACISHDTDEAIQLGILGTDPEDFALCSVICPSKTDFGALVGRMLEEIEEEGI